MDSEKKQRRIARRARSTAWSRQWVLMVKYGLTMEDVKAVLAEQGGVCALCLEPPARECIDHCHETEIFRGVLCVRCNAWLGFFEKAIRHPAWTGRAVAYLERAQTLAGREIRPTAWPKPFIPAKPLSTKSRSELLRPRAEDLPLSVASRRLEANRALRLLTARLARRSR